MKQLLLGNEGVARGLYEAGVRLVSSYPGTPSTEITEAAAKYDEITCEWAPNEKVAAEVAAGGCFAGARTFCAMKHVGLNVAADPFYTMSYIGVNGGMVLGVADDPGMHSSQNEQDSRRHAIAAKVPMLEPADSQECKEYTKLAFELSEAFDTPFVVRLTTRISHSRSLVELCDREERDLKPYEKNPQKNVMLPAFARPKHVAVEQRTLDLIQYAETSCINRVELNDASVGIITSGACYQYAKEAMGDSASYLKLGMVNPLPVELIKDFAHKVDQLYVIEELDDIIETHCKKIGVQVIGKELFPLCGEFNQQVVRELLTGEKPEMTALEEDIPMRPPAMCCGCPHRGLFYALKKEKVYVSGDIGCYTLGASAPLSMMDTCVCMGASVSALHGYNKVLGERSEKKSVAVIGDSTFIHSGVTGLIDIAYNASNSVVVILDNSITGMTGHQENPTTGKNIKGEPALAVNLEELCRSVGIKRVRVCDPYDIKETRKAIHEELEADGASVIISRRPCVLLKYVKHNPSYRVDEDKCIGCKSCMAIACPAISMKGKKAVIDHTQCVGCGVCEGLCPKNAIEEGKA